MKDQPLSIQQIEAAEMILTRKVDNLSFEDIAQRVGITSRQLRRWRDLPAFKIYLRDRAVEIAAESRAEILQTLTEKAKRGESAKMIELFLRVTDSFPAEKREITVEDDSRSTDEIEAEVERLQLELDLIERGGKH